MLFPPEINQPRPGRILIVGRDYGAEEMEVGHPFVGKAGRFLDKMLSEAGLRRADVNITNVVNIQPLRNEFSLHLTGHVELGLQQLRELVAELRPSLIITLGNEASFALVEGWPTQGNGIHGAKNISERRGYFWDTSSGTVLTTLHPAGILRKAVPGEFLFSADLRRAGRFLAGNLPREQFPEITRLKFDISAQLRRSQLVGWDIETKWEGHGLTCCGFCGDDLQPYVAVYPYEFDRFATQILNDPTIHKVGHNGKYDIAEIKHLVGIDVQGYTDDTQQMWWALEPEIAGDDEAGGDEFETVRSSKRMTRKGLAFLWSLNHNVEWWKNYPETSDEDYLPRITRINGIDCWATRIVAGEMLERIKNEDVVFQYQQAMNAYPALLDMQDEGLIVDEELRQERLTILTARKDKGADETREVALQYIKEHDVPGFFKMKKCSCCGGGKSQAQHCWRCFGLPKLPKKKADYLKVWETAAANFVGGAPPFKKCKVGELKNLMPPCSTCHGVGKIKEYFFNPFSPPQMKKLLHDVIGIPPSTFRGKIMMDEDAMKKILRWAKV